MQGTIDGVGSAENILLLTGEGAKKSPNIMVFVIPTVIQRMDKVAVGLKELLISALCNRTY